MFHNKPVFKYSNPVIMQAEEPVLLICFCIFPVKMYTLYNTKNTE